MQANSLKRTRQTLISVGTGEKTGKDVLTKVEQKKGDKSKKGDNQKKEVHGGYLGGRLRRRYDSDFVDYYDDDYYMDDERGFGLGFDLGGFDYRYQDYYDTHLIDQKLCSYCKYCKRGKEMVCQECRNQKYREECERKYREKYKAWVEKKKEKQKEKEIVKWSEECSECRKRKHQEKMHKKKKKKEVTAAPKTETTEKCTETTEKCTETEIEEKEEEEEAEDKETEKSEEKKEQAEEEEEEDEKLRDSGESREKTLGQRTLKGLTKDNNMIKCSKYDYKTGKTVSFKINCNKKCSDYGIVIEESKVAGQPCKVKVVLLKEEKKPEQKVKPDSSEPEETVNSSEEELVKWKDTNKKGPCNLETPKDADSENKDESQVKDEQKESKPDANDKKKLDNNNNNRKKTERNRRRKGQYRSNRRRKAKSNSDNNDRKKKDKTVHLEEHERKEKKVTTEWPVLDVQKDHDVVYSNQENEH